MAEPAFKRQLVDAIPDLRAYARSISGNIDRADDLVQETLAKAIAKRTQFVAGTNIKAWLVTILRNQYYSEGRKSRREFEDVEGYHAAKLSDVPRQLGHLEMKEFLYALQMLPEDQREALVLIGASGFSYKEAAAILGTRVGTVKSRVSRARVELEKIFDGSVPLVKDAASPVDTAAKPSNAGPRESGNLCDVG